MSEQNSSNAFAAAVAKALAEQAAAEAAEAEASVLDTEIMDPDGPAVEPEAILSAEDYEAEYSDACEEVPVDPGFAAFNFKPEIMRALEDAEYHTPTSIQREAIPPLMAGRDVMGQARTGTGKTAAFALPILQAIEPKRREVQALVLAPTRELAVQICDAMKAYSKYMPQVRVAVLYGGQALLTQARDLRAGAQIVVGTPGRIMDHIRRETLDLSHVKHLVLDEADEMLKMGFIEDVDWIIDQTSKEGRQTSLFSATMPPEIRTVGKKHLCEPQMIHVDNGKMAIPQIEQRYIVVHGHDKLRVLCRLLETQETRSALVFTRTRVTAGDLADALEERGYIAEPLHGEMSQAHRDRVVDRMRRGKVDVLVATDVAARGLDIEGISHVINFDIPLEPETYLHRIGRTGRAGREGVAILFVRPKERDLLNQIERFTKTRIQPMPPPSTDEIEAKRIAGFKNAVKGLMSELTAEDRSFFGQIVDELTSSEEAVDLHSLAAGFAALAQYHRPLRVPRDNEPAEMGPPVLLQLSLGRCAGIRPSDIVGTLANECGLPGPMIGVITVEDRYSFVEVPENFVEQILDEFSTLRGHHARVRVAPPGVKPRQHQKPQQKQYKERSFKGAPKGTDKKHQTKAPPPVREHLNRRAPKRG